MPLKVCEDADWSGFYEIKASQKSQFDAHKAKGQFWCIDYENFDSADYFPEAFINRPDFKKDIKLMNRVDSDAYTSLEFYLEPCLKDRNPLCKSDADVEAYMAGKQIMLVTNTQQIDFRQREIPGDKALLKESQLTWFGFRKSAPTTMRLTYQRYRYQPVNHALKMISMLDADPINYYSLPKDSDHLYIGTYNRQQSNNRVYAQVQFQVATNLLEQTPLTETNLAIMPWLGGWFFLLLALGRFATRFFYPFFMHLSVILRLFRVDPNKG